MFDWTAGFPLSNTLAGTENLLGWQGLYTPLRLLGLGVPLAYNVLVLVSFAASGIGTALLACQLGADLWGGAAAGLIFAFVPFHLSHAMHLQTLAVCWSPFALYFLDRYLREGGWRSALGLGASFVITAFSAVYFGVFLAFVLALYMALAWGIRGHRPEWHRLAGLAATALAAAAVLIPVALSYVRFRTEYGYAHPLGVLARFSVEPAALWQVPAWNRVWGSVLGQNARESAAFPGVVALLLIATYLLLCRQQPEGRGTGLLLAGVGIVCFVLSLGPVLRLSGRFSWSGVREIPLPGRLFTYVPGVRWPMRILLYTVLAGGVAAGLGLTLLRRQLPPQARIAVAVAVLALLTLEYLPAQAYTASSVAAVEPLAVSDAYPFLAREADRGGVIELPTRGPGGYSTPRLTRYVYGSAGHLRRVVAFHGSTRPPLLDDLDAAAARLPEEAARRFLRFHGVTRLVVHYPAMPPPVAATLVAGLRAHGYPLLHDGQEAAVFSLDIPELAGGWGRPTTSRCGPNTVRRGRSGASRHSRA